jgi:protein SCO1/2
VAASRHEPEATATGPSRRHRLPWGWVVVGLVLIGAAAVVARTHVAAVTLQGAVVTPPAPAPNFTLFDQDRRPVRLSDLRGKSVALTFLYTHCPDVCPLIATKMHETYLQLGGAATRIQFVAVTVDPKGDSPSAVRGFLATHQVEGQLLYLTGPISELRSVWSEYFVGTDAKEVNPQAVSVGPTSPDLVNHTAIVYVIDPRGMLRVFLPANFDPKDLAADLRILSAGAK